MHPDPIYIIAEAGVNHNGNIDLARKLIVSAKQAGADCVKFQTFRADQVATAAAPKASYQLQVTDRDESQLEMLKKLELDFDAHKELIEFCKQTEIDFLSTPYSIEDVAFLEQLGVTSYKVASGQLIEPLFLQAIARTGKPMIVSTGMATLSEVRDAVKAIRNTGNNRISLLQCTTNYPSRPEDANLRTIQTMASEFDILTGYSDHTQTDTACLVAVGLGARIIEKHLTLDKNMPGPDHSASADPEEFGRLVSLIREAEMTMGSGIKEPCAAERENAKGMRRSIVAKRPIRSGELISADMLSVKRPGTGLKPALITELTGKIATRDIEEESLINWDMLRNADA